MRINFSGSKIFMVTKSQVYGKKSVDKQEKSNQTTETQKDVNITSDSEVKTIDVQKLADKYVKNSKESADKIKELTEELKNLRLPKNPTKDDISNFVADIYSLKQRANEIYDALRNPSGSYYKTKCKEYDEFYYALMDFDKLVELKLTQAEIQSNTLRGVMSRALDNKLRTLA